jgi:hypothetical protein
VLSKLGNANATELARRAHSSPMRMLALVGGSAFQSGGSFFTGKYSVKLSFHSSRNEKYRSIGMCF